jgi:hypothetical protein
MLGCKSMASARATLEGMEMIHMMQKGRANAWRLQVCLAEQFHLLAAQAHDEAPVSSSYLHQVCNRTQGVGALYRSSHSRIALSASLGR